MRSIQDFFYLTTFSSCFSTSYVYYTLGIRNCGKKILRLGIWIKQILGIGNFNKLGIGNLGTRLLGFGNLGTKIFGNWEFGDQNIWE